VVIRAGDGELKITQGLAEPFELLRQAGALVRCQTGFGQRVVDGRPSSARTLTSVPAAAMAARSFFSTPRTARRRWRVGRPPVSMRWIAVLQTSPMLFTSPGMALSGQTV
jgi:hypothetical protein